MIASAHLAAGLVSGMAASRASGGTARRITIAALLGLASHMMMDAIPHADYGNMPRRWIIPVVLCEATVTFAVAALILRRKVTRGWPGFLAAGVFGATIPDARFGLGFLAPENKYRVLYATYWFHGFFHAEPVAFWIGMTDQVVATLACFAILIAFPPASEKAREPAGGYLP